MSHKKLRHYQCVFPIGLNDDCKVNFVSFSLSLTWLKLKPAIVPIFFKTFQKAPYQIIKIMVLLHPNYQQQYHGTDLSLNNLFDVSL